MPLYSIIVPTYFPPPSLALTHSLTHSHTHALTHSHTNTLIHTIYAYTLTNTPQVKPIVGNKAIETLERAVVRPSSVPFAPLEAEAVERLSPADLEAFLTTVRVRYI